MRTDLALTDPRWCRDRGDLVPKGLQKVGAAVYFLRKVLWTDPGFTVDAYRDGLLSH